MGGGGGVGGALRGAAAIGTFGLTELGGDHSIGDSLEGGPARRAAQGAADAAAAQNAQNREDALERSRRIEAESRRNETDTMALAKMSPQEMRQYEQYVSANDKQLKSDEALLSHVDPALLETSNKALQMLREGSGARSPQAQRYQQMFTDQRSQQRQKLVSSLQEQFGAGGEQSSVGLKALQQFDAQTSQMSMNVEMQAEGINQQANQQSFANIMGFNQQMFGQRPTNIGASSGNSLNAASMFRGRELQARQNAGAMNLNAMTGNASAMASANQAMMQTAGSQYTGDMMRAKNDQMWLNTGAQVGAAFLTKGGSLAAGMGNNSTPPVNNGEGAQYYSPGGEYK